VRLTPGAKLGPYEVLSLIGAGGMGEVYRARDSRLNRDVAIKVLPAERLEDEDRRRRFVQEAQAASALNHPHIITIYEIESADGIDFIVMELVRGKSLDALIPRHGMRLSELLRVAIPVADALAAAHARGIVHRDLKSANVTVGDDGTVKVLDFGLAKLRGQHETPEDETATRTAHVDPSMAGTIAGTAAYMSPEQASGGRVDARSDIFSFGAMLYEMVTGARAFAGASTVETLSAVIRAQPKAPSGLIADIPSDLEKVILRCLRKDPQRRYQHIDDVKIALQDIKEESESGATAPGPIRRSRSWRVLAVLAASLALVAIVLWLIRPRAAAQRSPLRVVSLTTLKGIEFSPTFSPDGEKVAFSWNGENGDNRHIYVKFVGSSEVRRLTTDSADDLFPSWSSDSRQIAFLRVERGVARLHLVSAQGGADSTLSDLPVLGAAAWSPDGRWLAAGRDPEADSTGHDAAGIYLLPVAGGEPRRLTRAHSVTGFDADAVFSADGHRLAYVSCMSTMKFGGCDVFVLDLDPAYRPVGSARQLTHESVNIIHVAWSRDGASLIYDAVVAPGSSYLWRVPIDRGSAPERLEIAGGGALYPATVSTRDRLAFARVTSQSGFYRFGTGGSPEPVLISSAWDTDARFSPDGRRVVFTSSRSGDATELWLAAADGSAAHQLTHGPSRWQGSPAWSPDGQRIAFDAQDAHGNTDIWLINADGGMPRRLTKDVGDENMPTWSHDGRWVYFSADEGKGRNVWRVPAAGGPTQRVTNGGSALFACESPDGNSLLYQREQHGDSPLLAVPVNGGAVRQLVKCVKPLSFGVSRTSIYYGACDTGPRTAIHQLDPVTNRDRLFVNIGPTFKAELMDIAPDDKAILVGRVEETADLMLIENFR
jgi:eukaryotic-like serine/threonine-protein kinase